MAGLIAKSLAGDAAAAPSRIDRLVLATINAPYKRTMTAGALAQCLSAARLEGWPSHVVSFFTEVRTELVLGFAAEHHVSKACLASAYQAMKSYSGESNPDLENEFVSLAHSS